MKRSHEHEEIEDEGARVEVDGDAAEPSRESGPPEETRPWLPTPPQIHRYKDPEAVAHAAAQRWLETAVRAVQKLDHFVVAANATVSFAERGLL